MRESFDKKLTDVKHKVLRMGAMVENVIEISMKSLMNHDVEMAKSVNVEDDKIDAMELEIEQDCMKLLALEQPLARDLRTVATALKIITDLERMGDHAVNIAKKTIEIGDEEFIKPLIDIPHMAEICEKMVHMSLDSFVNEDTELAYKVASMDEEVDKLFECVFNDLIAIIGKDNKYIKQGSELLFVGRYLERIADHTTNVCERVIYMVTGVLKEIN